MLKCWIYCGELPAAHHALPLVTHTNQLRSNHQAMLMAISQSPRRGFNPQWKQKRENFFSGLKWLLFSLPESDWKLLGVMDHPQVDYCIYWFLPAQKTLTHSYLGHKHNLHWEYPKTVRRYSNYSFWVNVTKMKLMILTCHLLIGHTFREKCIFTDYIMKEF